MDLGRPNHAGNGVVPGISGNQPFYPDRSLHGL